MRIYLDHNATTPVIEEIFQEMLPFLKEFFGNPSSIHWAGRETREAVEVARERAADFLNCKPRELVFTSCGSEGNNLVLKGAVESYGYKGNHIITTKVEHPAVLTTCQYLEKKGIKVAYLNVDEYGALDLDELKDAINPQTILISLMYANNETGTIFPIAEIGKVARDRGVLFHTDAVQAAGKIPLDVEELKVDFMTISGHKLYAPKGVGALYIRDGAKLLPLIHGGHQERNRRGGTENVAGIVALGKACQIAKRDLSRERESSLFLREKLWKGITEGIKEVKLNGHPTDRLPNTLNVSFKYAEGEALAMSLDLEGIAVSTGSACASSSISPSHVLLAMGVEPMLAQGSIRMSLGRGNNEEEIDRVLEVLPRIVKRLRDMSPLDKR